MKTTKVRLNQIYKSTRNSQYVIIAKQKGGKWKVKILSEKRGVYKGTHTLAKATLESNYQLVN